VNQIREIYKDEYKELYNHMKRDFTSDERAPYFAVKRNLDKKIYDGFYMVDDNTKIGYAVLTAPQDLKYALINYFAIMPEYRSKGHGSEFLKILLNRYSERNLILEADNPSAAKTTELKNQAIRRVKFYEQAGFRVIPTAKAIIFGIDMLIMASGSDENLNIREILHSLYLPAFGSTQWLRFIDVKNM